MTPIDVIEAIALVLWCYGAILLLAWVRAVAREDDRLHVAHFVSLMAVLVPVSVAMVCLIMVGGTLGLPSVVVFLALLTPGGLVVALQLEVSRLTAPSPQTDLARLGATLLLAAVVLYARGGL